jgi:hypothetical protein
VAASFARPTQGSQVGLMMMIMIIIIMPTTMPTTMIFWQMKMR